MYPEFVDNPVRIGNSLISIQKAITIKEASISPTLLKQDRDGYLAQLLSLDYGCTYAFILNFDHVKEKGEIFWKPVTKNPVIKTPFWPFIQTSVPLQWCVIQQSSNPINKCLV